MVLFFGLHQLTLLANKYKWAQIFLTPQQQLHYWTTEHWLGNYKIKYQIIKSNQNKILEGSPTTNGWIVPVVEYRAFNFEVKGWNSVLAQTFFAFFSSF